MTTHAPVAVEEYTGDREALLWLFELAEDSESELQSYLHRGRVLVARVNGQVAGHLLFVDTAAAGEVELTAATGYPPGIMVEGVPLRDRVWLDTELAP